VEVAIQRRSNMSIDEPVYPHRPRMLSFESTTKRVNGVGPQPAPYSLTVSRRHFRRPHEIRNHSTSKCNFHFVLILRT
jgi:hypothetical protein